MYTRKFIDSVLLLHYKSLDQRNEELNMLAPSSSSIMLDSAEIAINYAEDEDEGPGDIARSIIESMTFLLSLPLSTLAHHTL